MSDALDTVPLGALDRAFARFLAERAPPAETAHLWLAALASHQFGRGHACLDLGELARNPAPLLGWDAAAAALLPGALADAAASLPWCEGQASPLVLAAGAGAPRLYLRRAFEAEQRILASLAARSALPPPQAPTDLGQLLDGLFGTAPAAGVADQRRACEVAATGRFTVITGGPGTGKTTTVTRLLGLLAEDAKARGRAFTVLLAAPTGKAASRLSQSIGARLPELPQALRASIPTAASTLHKLLATRAELPPGKVAPLSADLVVVDEASMIDLEMMARLLEAVPLAARLVLLGDRDQLASVEAGAVLAQLCERQDLAPRIVTLRHSHRFANDSGIGRWAAHVNAGQRAAVAADWAALAVAGEGPPQPVDRLTRLGLHDAAFVREVKTGWGALLRALLPLRAENAQCGDTEALRLLELFGDFQVLAALRSGPWGTQQLNPLIERALGLPREPWYVGRPVMVTHNDYGLKLMNGDVGLCLPRDGGLRVAFRDAGGSLRWVLPSRLEAVETVFAMTVHKSQGSEFRHVLLVLPDRRSPVLTRELLYTGITRAMSRLTLLVPSRDVLLEAVGERVRRGGGLADGRLEALQR